MSKKLIAIVFLSTVMTLLGLLWFLQGAGIVHIEPILCAANCEPIEGKSLLWQNVGIVVFLAGITTIGLSIRHAHRQRNL